MSNNQSRCAEQPRSNDPLVAMFDAGRRFNELRWESDQAVVLNSLASSKQVEELIGSFAFEGTAQLPTLDQEEASSRRVIAIQKEWKRWTGSLDFVDIYDSSVEEFAETAEATVAKAFWSRLSRAKSLRKQIRKIIESRIEESEALKVAFALGEFVDQGLRPFDFVEHLWREVPNPKFAHARLPNSEVVRSYRTPTPTPRRRIEPATIMIWAYLPPGSLPAPSWWFDKVESTLRRLKIPQERLTSVLAEFRNFKSMEIPEIVEIVAQAVRGDRIESIRAKTPQVNRAEIPSLRGIGTRDTHCLPHLSKCKQLHPLNVGLKRARQSPNPAFKALLRVLEPNDHAFLKLRRSVG